MATPVRVQTVTAASSTLSPTSIAFTLTSTGVGSYLFARLAFAASAANQTITTPTNWTLLASLLTQTGIGYALYGYPSNPGSITTVTFSGLTNLYSIAGSISEISGVGQNPPVSPLVISSAQSGTAVAAGATLITNSQQLAIGSQFNAGTATYTDASPNSWASGGATSSTTGTVNVTTIPVLYEIDDAQVGSINLTGTLSGSNPWVALYALFLGANSYPLQTVQAGGYTGLMPVGLGGAAVGG